MFVVFVSTLKKTDINHHKNIDNLEEENNAGKFPLFCFTSPTNFSPLRVQHRWFRNYSPFVSYYYIPMVKLPMKITSHIFLWNITFLIAINHTCTPTSKINNLNIIKLSPYYDKYTKQLCYLAVIYQKIFYHYFTVVLNLNMEMS